MKNWNPNGGFPTDAQLKRMVEREVRLIAEERLRKEQESTEKREARRDRLRRVYWRCVAPTGQKVDFEAVLALVGRVSSDTLYAWKKMNALDLASLADAGRRDGLDDLEFIVNRSLGELNAIKNIVCLAKALA